MSSTKTTLFHAMESIGTTATAGKFTSQSSVSLLSPVVGMYSRSQNYGLLLGLTIYVSKYVELDPKADKVYGKNLVILSVSCQSSVARSI